MAKPRIFVSSTYYDLKHIRNSLQAFIDSFGYESVLYEEGDIPFHHDSSLDISCYDEIKKSHIFVLIIGGRYGSPASDQDDVSDKLVFYNSVTKKEYETARSQDIPIYIFIEKNVLAEFHTYKKNRSNKSIEYAHVDNVNIFKLIDELYSQKRNNLIKEFEKFDDISTWLREQWAGLFADFLSKGNTDKDLNDLASQISDLKDVNSVLKEYSESIMSKLQPENFENIIQSSNKKLREKHIARFQNNPMIEYFLDHTPKGVGAVKLYSYFEQSNTLKDFLKLANFDAEFIEKMTEHSEARKDYIELKNEM